MKNKGFIIEDINGKIDIKLKFLDGFIDITSWNLTFNGIPIRKLQFSLYEKLCLMLFEKAEKILTKEKLEALRECLIWEILGRATITSYSFDKVIFRSKDFKIAITYHKEKPEYWMEDEDAKK